jgi:serine protease Do
VLYQSLARALLHAALIAAFLSGYPCLQPTANAAGVTPLPAKEKRTSPANASAPVDFPAIVERYGPAVVNISATAPERQSSTPAPAV